MIKNKGISKKNKFIYKTHEMLKVIDISIVELFKQKNHLMDRIRGQVLYYECKIIHQRDPTQIFCSFQLCKFSKVQQSQLSRSLNMYGFSSYKNKKGQKIIFHKHFKQSSVQYSMFHRTQPTPQNEEETMEYTSEDLQQILKDLLYQQNIMKQQIIQQVQFMQQIKNQYIQHLHDLWKEQKSCRIRGQKFLNLLFKILRGLELSSYDSKNEFLELIFSHKDDTFIASPQPKDEYGIFFDDSIRSSPITHKVSHLMDQINYGM